MRMISIGSNAHGYFQRTHKIFYGHMVIYVYLCLVSLHTLINIYIYTRICTYTWYTTRSANGALVRDGVMTLKDLSRNAFGHTNARAELSRFVTVAASAMCAKGVIILYTIHLYRVSHEHLH